MKKDKKISPQLFKAVSIDRDLFQIRFVMSTPEVDRHGEMIDQSGWDFSKYLLNPVVLWGHDQSIPAVGKIILIENVNGNTEGVVQFAVKENPDAKILFDLYAEGYMSAVSVGFMNTKWMYDEENDLLTLLENELYELSLVNVPANASALAKAKTKGIDVDVIKRLDKHVDKDEKFKGLGEKVEKKDADDADAEIPEPTDQDIEGADDPDKDPEDLGTETAETEEEKAARLAKEKEEGQEPTEEEVKAALEVLFKSNREIIKASVKELTSRLNDAKEDKKESSVDASPTQGLKKGLSNRRINSLVRSLLNSKS